MSLDIERANKYELTEVLFRQYDLRMRLGHSSLIRHREAMIGVLEFLKENPDCLKNRAIKNMTKHFNRLGAVKQLVYLDRTFFKTTCENMKHTFLL